VRRKTLSVVIPTYNAERFIARCLDALTWADEVIVVDMFSTDRTPEICRSYPNVKFVQRDEKIIYANVNYGFDLAQGDWVMRLDSDEIVTPELAREIQEKILAKDEDENDGYVLPSRLHCFGRWIKHCGINDPRRLRTGYTYRLHIFKRGLCRYSLTHQHEDIDVPGKKGWLTHPYDHYSIDSISQWIAKTNYYTDRDAEAADLSQVHINWRTILKVATSPLVGFFRLYVLRQGYQDGIWGLILCLLGANYYMIQELKKWERKLKETTERSVSQ